MIELTASEARYVSLLAGGLTPSEISSRLKIKSHTLRCSFYQIRKKLGVKTNTQLVSVVLTEKLTSQTN